MRRIIQIAACSDSRGDTLYAFCDDQSLWALYDRKWERMPDISQAGLKKSRRDYPDPFEEVPVTQSSEPVPELKAPEEGQTD